MYCVAWERHVKIGRDIKVYPYKDYFQATDVANCRFQFLAANPGVNAKIVAIGPVLGYHSLDDHGDSVIA
jgi:hypothetical protein